MKCRFFQLRAAAFFCTNVYSEGPQSRPADGALASGRRWGLGRPGPGFSFAYISNKIGIKMLCLAGSFKGEGALRVPAALAFEQHGWNLGLMLVYGRK